jgi:hypothetical protein
VIGEVALGGINRTLYAVVSDSIRHTNPNSTYTSGSARTLRLDPTGWAVVERGSNQPLSQLAATPVRNSLLIAGSLCPAGTGCMEEAGAAGLITAHSGIRNVQSPQGMPYPRDVTAGGTAAVVTFPTGSIGTPIPGPREGTTWIYNILTGDWVRGPTAPAATGDDGTYWTPHGVITLGAPTGSGFGGAILVPAE